MTTITTLLIANRGEIALRVIRAASGLGIRTAAVYSDADRAAPHVREADVAVRVGSYLSIPDLLAAAEKAGADAVHPGYGFLSERAAFARAVAGAGLVFVGPSADVMDQMGRKDAARAIAVAAGVPVVPSYPVDADPASFTYPVLVKAAAGGGGKGMRIVAESAGFPAAAAAARREAASAFGDDTLLVERYVARGRHVEVQVLADHHGNVVHLFERDCSAQRRHQKVIEEAPAPDLAAGVRATLLDAAVALARKVGYTNAGTVEFLVSGAEAFFLEMNTRLQVEHPVTEAVTGLDLVQLQLRIAAGEVLPFAQQDVRCDGHAFEARVYAEDAFNGFLPQAGTATLVRWPRRARTDAALESGSVVSTSYDPMLGKIIVHGPTREAARQALVTALDDTAILGLTTNAGFLRALAAAAAFRDGEVHTAWLDHHAESIRPPAPELPRLLGAWVAATARPAGAPSGLADGSPFGLADGWRLGGPSAPLPVTLDGHGYSVDPAGSVDGRPVHQVSVDPLRLEVDGVLAEAVVSAGPHVVEVAYHGHTFRFARPDPFGPDAATSAGDGTVLAPMPGTVTSVLVAAGDQVTAGDVLGVLEAMKMEISLKAAIDGTVTVVGAAKGDQVALRQVLFDVAPG